MHPISSQSIGERLDRLPWKRVHTVITLALGVGWMLDALEVTIVSNVLGVLERIWHLTQTQASYIVSIWLVGIMAGALFFGYLADRFGRRKLFVVTLLGYSICTVISALAPGYAFFLCFRFLTAIGVGAEYSAINAAIGEMIPARYRGRANAAVMNFWPLGAILAAAITYGFINLFPPSVGWRLAFALGTVIALFTVWARKVLPESPRWLMTHGRETDAMAVLARLEGNAAMQSEDGPPDGPMRPHRGSSQEGFFRQLRLLLWQCPGRLALGCALDFSEAAGYYGIFAFLALVVLPRVNITEGRVPVFYLLGNVGAAFGGALAAIFLDCAGRKITVTVFYSLAAVSMLLMAAATAGGSSQGVMWAFIVANFCATGSWVAAYPTFSEIFPTDLRSTGIGFSVAFGRIGAAIAPPLLVSLAARISVTASFGVLAGFWALGALAMIPWSLYGPEGRGRSLEGMMAVKSQ